jgi:hypothetical protein
MKLTKVRAWNIKGTSFELTLDEMTIFRGENMVNKTARLEAIALVLLGYVPAYGKEHSKTFGLCSGRELKVEGEFDDGTQLRRRWYAKGNSVRCEEELPPAFREANREQLAVMLDADVYLGLGPTARIDYVFANVPGLSAELNPDAIDAMFQRALFTTEDLNSNSCNALVDRFRAFRVEQEAAPNFQAWNPQTYVDALVEFVTSDAKITKAHVGVFEKTVQGLAHLRTHDQPETDLAALDVEHRMLSLKLTALRDARALLAAQQEQARVSKRRRDDLTRELVSRSSLLATKGTQQNRLQQFEADLAAMPEVMTEKALLDLENEWRTADYAARDTQKDLLGVEDGLTRNANALREIEGMTKCPACGATGEGWKTLKRAEITSAIDGLKTKKTQLSAHLVEVKRAAAALQTRVTNEKNARGLRLGKEREVTSAKQAIASTEKSLAVLEEKQRQLDLMPSPADIQPQLDESDRMVAECSATLNLIEEKRRAHDGRKHELTRLAQSEQQRDESIVAEDVGKAAVKIVKELKATIVQRALAPVLQAANDFFHPAILPYPLTFVDGEIGWMRDGVWVAHRYFSGIQKAMAYSAIQIALASMAPVKFLMLDELGIFSHKYLVKMLDCIAAAISRGDLVQFVGVEVSERLGAHELSGEAKLAIETVI